MTLVYCATSDKEREGLLLDFELPNFSLQTDR
jgi:hypothetical protein